VVKLVYPVHMYGNMDAINVWGTRILCPLPTKCHCTTHFGKKKDPKGYYNSNATYCCSI